VCSGLANNWFHADAQMREVVSMVELAIPRFSHDQNAALAGSIKRGRYRWCRVIIEYHSQQFMVPVTLRDDGRFETRIPGDDQDRRCHSQ
jgi:hypothetical protein